MQVFLGKNTVDFIVELHWFLNQSIKFIRISTIIALKCIDKQ
jgi:hypothetical protein